MKSGIGRARSREVDERDGGRGGGAEQETGRGGERQRGKKAERKGGSGQ